MNIIVNKNIVNNTKFFFDIVKMFNKSSVVKQLSTVLFIMFTMLSNKFVLLIIEQFRFRIFFKCFFLKHNVFNVVQYCVQCSVLSWPCAPLGAAAPLLCFRPALHAFCHQQEPLVWWAMNIDKMNSDYNKQWQNTIEMNSNAPWTTKPMNNKTIRNTWKTWTTITVHNELQ